MNLQNLLRIPGWERKNTIGDPQQQLLYSIAPFLALENEGEREIYDIFGFQEQE